MVHLWKSAGNVGTNSVALNIPNYAAASPNIYKHVAEFFISSEPHPPILNQASIERYHQRLVISTDPDQLHPIGCFNESSPHQPTNQRHTLDLQITCLANWLTLCHSTKLVKFLRVLMGDHHSPPASTPQNKETTSSIFLHTVDGRNLHQLIDGLFHYNPIIYSVSELPIAKSYLSCPSTVCHSTCSNLWP